MNILVNILAAIVVLGGLVTFHEYGHFWAARRCGVRVLAFSIGFGRPLWVRQGRDGTRYMVSMLPLGGYVRLHDRQDDPAVDRASSDAFEDKPLWARAFIMLAGPLANFLLAIVVYWGLFMYGVSGIAPVIGSVVEGSPAAQAGLAAGQEITAIDQRAVRTWQQVDAALRSLDGNDVVETDARQQHTITLGEVSPTTPAWEALGVVPWQPVVSPVLGTVVEEGPAHVAGLQAGDRILDVAQQPVGDWQAVVSRLRYLPVGQPFQLVYERQGERREITLTPTSRETTNGQRVNYIGAGAVMPAWPDHYRRVERAGPIDALGMAVSRTWQLSAATLGAMGKMVTGALSPRNLSGPVMISKVAGDTARSGAEAFIGFLAYLSISLGILNLMPVPMLDGGHLLYFAFEAIRGRPLPERVQLLGRCIGMVLIGSLMIAAFYFDLTRV